MTTRYDAVVVGAGPNGLAAAITLAEQGFSVHVVEASDDVGGACRTAELTLPGFHHDVGAAVLTFGTSSRFFRDLAGADGVEFVHSPAVLAHPLDGDDAVVLERSVGDTAAGLGRDETSYRRAFTRLTEHAPDLLDQFLGPLRPPRHPLIVGAFGAPALLPASLLARSLFRGDRARALFAGMSGHSMMSLNSPASASIGLVLGMVGHSVGWPVVRGGSGNVSVALADRVRSLGGTIETGRRVTSLRQLPPSRVQLLDLVPRSIEAICVDALPPRYRRRLRRYRYGPGLFKLDWALAAPIPWRDERCARAATVHLGGSLDEVVGSESTVAGGGHPERPFVILVQPSLFDASRAPGGGHTAWAYGHVPNGSRVDMTTRIEAQVERFAPGFRDRVIGRHTMDTAALEAYDANLVGGDINGGLFSLGQMFTRPAPRVDPYSTPNPRVFICSAATPPGGGVHGMCGWWAAQSALRALRKPSAP
ncbi:MAG: NAD(P)/FAD-dependent oxidoreductase [Candidatus Dormibacteraeota bacterium]|uniref:FAD-dependent oxidoreductase n=1 Tax=Candidatus Aeolococcus gillhamiae TaxID=3127015 RepID=A0A2W5Z4A7_9BACT|nr:NAD(P)/FAD-dependent oxidoreductase [Candidatus Dormibacteraeota bacterium]PZR77695.1 MAG: FAD-dependent oxidoreductase [Candidatus Dormibacter sp. RRmetagenome_bin12]